MLHPHETQMFMNFVYKYCDQENTPSTEGIFSCCDGYETFLLQLELGFYGIGVEYNVAQLCYRYEYSWFSTNHLVKR